MKKTLQLFCSILAFIMLIPSFVFCQENASLNYPFEIVDTTITLYPLKKSGIIFITLRNVSGENQQIDSMTYRLQDVDGNPLSATLANEGYIKIDTFFHPLFLDVVQPGETTYLQDSFTFAIGEIDKFNDAVITEYSVKAPEKVYNHPIRLTVKDPGEVQFLRRMDDEALSAYATIRNETEDIIHNPVLTVLCYNVQNQPFAMAEATVAASLPQGGEITLYPNLFTSICRYSDIYATELLESISRVEYFAYASGRTAEQVLDTADWFQE